MSSASDISTLQRESYSAKVEMYLHVLDRRLNIGRIGGNLMTLRETCDIPANTPAMISIAVDGEADCLQIVLHNGIKAGADVVEYTRQS